MLKVIRMLRTEIAMAFLALLMLTVAAATVRADPICIFLTGIGEMDTASGECVAGNVGCAWRWDSITVGP